LKLKGENRLILSLKSDAHKYLAQVYEEQKNYPLCIQHWKQYKTLMDKSIDTLLSQEPGRKVIKAESERDLLIKQKEVDRQKWMSILGFSVAFFVLFGAIINYRFYKREQERKQELASLNATKDRLFAILSHDLMSPIGTLKNYLSLMDWGVMNQEQFSQSSERLKIKVNNLYNLLENVLHWSITQMQGIKPKVETVNINEVVSEQIALVSSIAETKGITLTQAIKSDATIQADKNHLRLIVRNLLQNALKFTPKGGTIHFSREDTEGGQKLTIQDTGIGMPNETLDKLFKVEQNTNRKGTAQEGGTGLGLILTKELVELNGGKITVSSEEGRGTTFSVVF
jgi:signal transduction histidine kinase